MPHFGAISHREFVRYLKALGFEGPYAGSKHLHMSKGGRTYTIPNPHNQDISLPLLGRVLRQLGLSREEWESL